MKKREMAGKLRQAQEKISEKNNTDLYGFVWQCYSSSKDILESSNGFCDESSTINKSNGIAKIRATHKNLSQRNIIYIIQQLANVQEAFEKDIFRMMDLQQTNLAYERLKEFTNAIGIYYQNKKIDDLPNVLNLGSMLQNNLYWINASIEMYLWANGLVSFSEEKKEKELSLELYLTNVNSLEKFGEKLIILDQMYYAILELTGESSGDHPLIIKNIENGSQLTNIMGHPVVIGVLINVLSGAALHFITEYNKAEKIEPIPKNVANIEKILQISNELEAKGIDTKEIDALLKKATLKVAEQAFELLSDQPEVEVNEKKFGVHQELKPKMLEEIKALNYKPDDIA
ncbi:hypothetical protein AB4381_21935 [Vibrio splendidus]